MKKDENSIEVNIEKSKRILCEKMMLAVATKYNITTELATIKVLKSKTYSMRMNNKTELYSESENYMCDLILHELMQ